MNFITSTYGVWTVILSIGKCHKDEALHKFKRSQGCEKAIKTFVSTNVISFLQCRQ